LVLNAVITPLVLPKSTEAWVNAPLVIVRAEAEGSFGKSIEVSQSVKAGQVVGILTNKEQYQDRSHRARLETEKAYLEAERKRFDAELHLAEELKKTSSKGLGDYGAALVRGLEAALREAEAKVHEYTVGHEQSKRVLDLKSKLYARNAISDDEFYRSQEAVALAQSLLDQGNAAKERIQTELDAARALVFVQRDSPVYLLWSLQVQQSIPQAVSRIAEAKLRLDAVTAELHSLDDLAKNPKKLEVRSPVEGVVWRRNGTSGPVGKGELLLEVADTKEMFIEAQVPAFHAAALVKDRPVTVLFSGCAPLAGTIRGTRQPNPTDLDMASAIRLSRRLSQVIVEIKLDKNENINGSFLGRPCRVLVADRDTDWRQRLDTWVAVQLFCKLRW